MTTPSNNGLTSDAARLTSLATEIGQALIDERRAVQELQRCQARVRNLRAQRELMDAQQREPHGAATHFGKPQWMGGK